MLDWLFWVLYAIAFAAFYKKGGFYVAAFVFLACMAIPAEWFITSTVFVMLLQASINMMGCYYLAKTRRLITASALFIMAGYLIFFAIDSWINGNVETWSYNNHEYIVAVLHVLIVMSISDRAANLVGACNRYFNRARMFGTSSHAHFDSSERRKVKKEAN